MIDRDAAVMTLTYSFAKGASASTFAARMGDGNMLVVSPSTTLTDAAAVELEAFGPVTAIVANNGFHHLGQMAWRERFPQATCYAAPEAIVRIKKKAPEVGDFQPLSALAEMTGPDVGVREVPDTKIGESWCWAKIEGGYAWYVSDVLINLESLPPSLMPKVLFWLSKSAPGFRVFNLALKFMVKNKKATLQLLLADMEGQAPTVIVPGHGAMITTDDPAARARTLIQAAL